MNLYHKDLKMYADSGLRTEADWSGLGREIKADSASRATVEYRGSQLPLYTRDQTRVRAERRDPETPR